jgi:PAS domain S-box-containing protein
MSNVVPFGDVLRCVRWSAADEAALRALAPHVAPERRAIVADFYDRVREHPAAERALRDEEQAGALHRLLDRWLDELLSVGRDAAYFERRHHMGVEHVRAGLPRRYALAAMSLVRLRLERVASAAFAADRAVEAAVRAALGKALDLELAVVAEAYDDAARARAEGDPDREGAAAPVGADAFYREAVERAEVAVVALDAGGRATLWNREAEALTGCRRDEVLGSDPLPLVLGDAHAGLRERVLATRAGEPAVLEVVLAGPAGGERWVRWRASAFEDEAGSVAARYLVGADVTEAHLADRRARQAERLAVADALATALAHELRNPLNTVSLHVQLLDRSLRRHGDVPAVASESLATLTDELDRFARLVTEFLAFARPRPLRPRPVDVAEVVRGVADSMAAEAEAAGVEVSFDAPEGPLPAPLDVEAIRRALQNVTRNAIEAVAGRPEGKVALRVRSEGHFVAVDVEDNGPGVAPGAPVFDAFYTTKSRGPGLGLAVAHRLVDDHGGSLAMRSAPGSTSCTVRLRR